MLPIFSLWNAFSFSRKGTFLRWNRRCTANMRLTWAHSRLTGLRRQWAAGSSEFTAFSLHPGKHPPNRLSLPVPGFRAVEAHGRRSRCRPRPGGGVWIVPPFLAFLYGHRRVYIGMVHPDLSGKYRVSGVFRDSLHLPLSQKGGLQGYMCLVCGLSQGSSVREHGDEPPYLGWLKLGRMKDGTRSAGEGPAAIRARPSLVPVCLSVFLQAVSVAVRALAEKGS